MKQGNHPKKPRKKRPVFGCLLALLLACAVAFVGFFAVPNLGTCASKCGRRCARTTVGQKRIFCDAECRARCVCAHTQKDVASAASAARVAKKVRIGNIDVAVLEFNVSLEKLTKAALQLRTPLVAPRQSTSTSVDLRPVFARRRIGIEDQKETSTCMAHALTSAMEYALVPELTRLPTIKRAGAPRVGVNLSRKHAHSLSLHATGVCVRNSERGSWVLHAASAIRAEGTFLESKWPFRPWDPTSKGWKSCEEAINGGKPSEAALAARHFFIEEYYYLPPITLPGAACARTPSHLEGILDLGHPVILALFLFQSSFDKAYRNGGHVRIPKNENEPDTLHYVLLVGFDRKKSRFIFANSWGKNFGSNGFGFLPYEYVSRYALEALFISSMRIKNYPSHTQSKQIIQAAHLSIEASCGRRKVQQKIHVRYQTISFFPYIACSRMWIFAICI